jgi:hypothetical protein
MFERPPRGEAMGSNLSPGYETHTGFVAMTCRF